MDMLDQEQFYALVEKYEEQFMTEGWPLGKTGSVKHSIYTRNQTKTKTRTPGHEGCDKGGTTKMEDQGVIEPSNSLWASPVVLFKQKERTVRFCIDNCKVNKSPRRMLIPFQGLKMISTH